MSSHRKRLHKTSGASSVVVYALCGLILLATVFWWSWPDEVKPVVSAPPPGEFAESKTSEEPIESVRESIRDMNMPSTLRPTKESVARVGLGASLAQAPLPKPASRQDLPKDLSLGEHTISLKGGEWRLRLTLTLSSEGEEFIRYAAPLRRRLIQMIYFLVSHRVPEGMRTASGEERLRSDLKERFQNVLRGQEFELYIDGYSLERVEDLEEFEE